MENDVKHLETGESVVFLLPRVINEYRKSLTKEERNSFTKTYLQQETGLNYITVRRWVDGTINRLDFETLGVWCKTLDRLGIVPNCTPGDLLKLEREVEEQ